MTKRIFANRFGLVALMSLSLFASTAFAGNGPTQVVVTNTPAQPVPMVRSDHGLRRPSASRSRPERFQSTRQPGCRPIKR